MAYKVTPTEEGIYRDGYHAGYAEAINAIGALIFEQGIDPDQAHARLFAFWQEELLSWKLNDLDRFVLPPHCEDKAVS